MPRSFVSTQDSAQRGESGDAAIFIFRTRAVRCAADRAHYIKDPVHRRRFHPRAGVSEYIPLMRSPLKSICTQPRLL
jgi:hypothetical protein